MIFTSKIKGLACKHALHIRHVFYFVGTRLLTIGGFVLVVPFFIKHASADQYGSAAIGFSLLGIATVLDVAFGYVVIQSVGRRYARGRSPSPGLISGLFTCYLLLCSMISISGFAVVMVLPLSSSEILMFGSITALLPALCVSGVVSAVFQARNQLNPITASRFGFESVKVVSMLLSAAIFNDISLIGPVLLVGACVRATLDVRYLADKTGIVLRASGISAVRKYWKLALHGATSLLIVVLSVVITITDKIVVKKYFDLDSVAYYSIAFDINSKAYLIVNAVNASLFSVILHQFARKSQTLGPLLVSITVVGVVGIMYYLPLAIFAPTVISHWINESFANNSSALVRSMSAASLFYLLGNIFEVSLTAMGQVRLVMPVYLIGFIIYAISMFAAVWMHELVWIMNSYLILCVVLCLGFVFQYRRVVHRTANI